MNRLIFLFPLFFLACQAASPEDEIPEMEASVDGEVNDWEDNSNESSNIILGKWQMDSAVFIDDEVDGKFEPPLIPTTWTFNSDNSYIIENNIQLSGSYTFTKENLVTELMGMDTDYEIIQLNVRSMILKSVIYENEDGSLKTRAYLTKISD